jgi:hypothetical protein
LSLDMFINWDDVCRDDTKIRWARKVITENTRSCAKSAKRTYELYFLHAPMLFFGFELTSAKAHQRKKAWAPTSWNKDVNC